MNFKKYHVSRNLLHIEPKTADVRAVTATMYSNRITLHGTASGSGGRNIKLVDNFVLPAGTYYAKTYGNSSDAIFYLNKASDSSVLASLSGTMITIEQDTEVYMGVNVISGTVYNETNITIMLNTGSTPLPYEPYSSEVWHDTPHYIHNTSADTLTTLPAVLYPNDTTATVGLKGQTVQSGKPTHDSPIMPQGTGERTGNLINVPDFSDVRWATPYPSLLNAINSLPNGVYTMSVSYELTSRNDATDSSVCGWYIAKNSRVLSNIRLRWETAQIGDVITTIDTFTIDDNNRGAFTSLYLYGCGINGAGQTGTAIATNIMLNSGSQPLPYEPFGVKIPISSADTTTPVYLGEVESTRRIYKLVLTGQESWYVNSTGNTQFFFTTVSNEAIPNSEIICTHFENANIGQTTTVVGVGFAGTVQLRVRPENTSAETVISFKQWLIDQYAAGTPVTVWYVLATPTTGIVNEPLMKIGNYADTVSGISIPVTAGGDTISVGTTVQPSEVTVNYKGWHPVADVHERENGQWD